MKRCHECEQENADNQTYCGYCGSPLKLADYLSIKVQEQLSTSLRDRDVLETESSIKVFEKAWGWVKTILSIASVLVVLLGAGIFWKASDLWSSVDKAKLAVQSTAKSSQQEISQSSSAAVKSIGSAAASATDASNKASSVATKQANDAVSQTTHLKSDLNQEAVSVRSEVGHARTELAAVNELRPQITSMQEQLNRSNSEVQAQQKTLSSTEEFVKKVFSSHVTRLFDMSVMVTKTSVIIPPKEQGKGNTVVYLLLPEAPIEETLALQWRISVQPRYSFIHIKNIVIFFWGDSTDTLKTQPLQVSYFPDTGDKDIAHTLSYHDGRVFADDQPMPKLNEADPDFKGNKWIQLGPQKP